MSYLSAKIKSVEFKNNVLLPLIHHPRIIYQLCFVVRVHRFSVTETVNGRLKKWALSVRFLLLLWDHLASL